jgi:hypothetical protein
MLTRAERAAQALTKAADCTEGSTIRVGVACDPLSYAGIGATEWARVQDAVGRTYGMTIDSERGEASKRGFTLAWTYDPNGQTLQIQCSKKPFLVPCARVNDRINQMAEECGITAA